MKVHTWTTFVIDSRHATVGRVFPRLLPSPLITKKANKSWARWIMTLIPGEAAARVFLLLHSSIGHAFGILAFPLISVPVARERSLEAFCDALGNVVAPFLPVEFLWLGLSDINNLRCCQVRCRLDFVLLHHGGSSHSAFRERRQ